MTLQYNLAELTATVKGAARLAKEVTGHSDSDAVIPLLSKALEAWPAATVSTVLREYGEKE